MTDDRLDELLEGHLDSRLTEAEVAELQAELRVSPAARQRYWDAVEQHVLVEDILREARGQDLAAVEGRRWSITDRPPQRRLQSRWLWGLGLVAASILIGMGFWLGTGRLPGPSEEGDVRVVELAGKAEVVSAAGKEPAQLGQRIMAGQSIRTGGEQSFIVLEYPDRTRLELGSETTIALAFDSSVGKRVTLANGSLLADVPPQPAGRPMVVAGPRGEMRVSDTRFLLASATPEGSRLDLSRGQGLVVATDGKPVRVDAGQSAFVSTGVDDVLIRPMPAMPAMPRAEVNLAGLQSVAFAADGRTVLASTSYQAVFWDGEGRLETVPLFKNRWDGVVGVWSPDGKVLAVGNHRTKQILFWHPAERRFGGAIDMPDGIPRELVVAPGGRWLAALDFKEPNLRVRVWDAATNQEIDFPKLDHRVGGFCASADGQLLAVGRGDMGESNKNQLLLYDPLTAELKGSLPTRVKVVGGMAFSPDGRLLAAGARGKLYIWDLTTRTLLRTISGHERHLLTLAFSPDGRHLAGATHQGPVWIWNMADGSEHAILDVRSQGAHGLAFSPDGRSLALIVEKGKALQLWDIPAASQP